MSEIALALLVECAKVLKMRLPHLGIAVNAGAVLSLLLDFARTRHTFANFAGTFPRRRLNHFIIVKRKKFDMDVNPVQERSGDFAPVTLDLWR